MLYHLFYVFMFYKTAEKKTQQNVVPCIYVFMFYKTAENKTTTCCTMYLCFYVLQDS